MMLARMTDILIDSRNRLFNTPSIALLAQSQVCPWAQDSKTNVKELLLADTHQLSASPSGYEATRRQRDAAAYQNFMLSESDFDDLVFMKASASVWANNQKLVDLFTPKGRSRTLKEVVDRILEVYPHESPMQVFKRLSEDEPWFEGCFIISARV